MSNDNKMENVIPLDMNSPRQVALDFLHSDDLDRIKEVCIVTRSTDGRIVFSCNSMTSDVLYFLGGVLQKRAMEMSSDG